MKIGKREYSEILVTDVEGNLLARITDNDIIEEKNCKVVCVPDGNMRTEEVRKITTFDAVKQLELDVFCDVMYGIVKDVSTQAELKAVLQEKMPKEALQRINEAALREGYQPISFSG